MKTFPLLALLALGALAAKAQDAQYFTYASLPVDATTHLVTYTDAVPTPGVSKELLLARAQAWANRFFIAGAKAPQMLDVAAGTYSCQGVVRLPYGTTYTMVLALAATNGSYTYTINQLFYEYSASSSDALSGTRAESAEHWATYKKKNLHYVDVRIHEVRQFLPELLAGMHAFLTAAGDSPAGTR